MMTLPLFPPRPMPTRFERSRPGFVWIGGRNFGRAVSRAYDGPPCNRDAADLAGAVRAICDAIKCVHEERFDRRLARCAKKSADMAEYLLSRVKKNT
jgi:hypothetical protein